MPRFETYYLSNETADKINKLVTTFAASDKHDTNELLEQLSSLLPIKKTDISTVRQRVEGFYYTTEILWQEALKLHRGDRQEIVRMANLKPFSHYHYLVGSREPVSNVLTRADYLNDPTTALIKLRDDIIGYAKTLPQLKKNTA